MLYDCGLDQCVCVCVCVCVPCLPVNISPGWRSGGFSFCFPEGIIFLCHFFPYLLTGPPSSELLSYPGTVPSLNSNSCYVYEVCAFVQYASIWPARRCAMYKCSDLNYRLCCVTNTLRSLCVRIREGWSVWMFLVLQYHTPEPSRTGWTFLNTVMSRLKAGLIPVDADTRARLLFKPGISTCVNTKTRLMC